MSFSVAVDEFADDGVGSFEAFDLQSGAVAQSILDVQIPVQHHNCSEFELESMG